MCVMMNEGTKQLHAKAKSVRVSENLGKPKDGVERINANIRLG